ncbi:protein of unknown function [Bradyrhizobium vignae]|uniref:Uncharacterized protein n=1 Tax=Bradyrhizobium vignae TaxID=1549949 RepID=A0A2U3PQ25_9BRAD|nr:protein of unknown function [Bradyrhizobium vignae]
MSPAHDMLNVAAELAADETTTLAAGRIASLRGSRRSIHSSLAGAVLSSPSPSLTASRQQA